MRRTRRDSKIRATENALFDRGRGSAVQIAKRIGCSKSTAYRHLNTLVAEGLAVWGQFLPRKRGYPRSYALTERGRLVVAAGRKLQDDLRFLTTLPEPLKEYMGLDSLITTGYATAGKGVSIQEAAREGLPVREWRW